MKTPKPHDRLISCYQPGDVLRWHTGGPSEKQQRTRVILCRGGYVRDLPTGEMRWDHEALIAFADCTPAQVAEVVVQIGKMLAPTTPAR